MKRLLQLISLVGLGLSLVPALMLFRGSISQDAYYNLMNLGMVLWFASAIFWIKPHRV